MFVLYCRCYTQLNSQELQGIHRESQLSWRHNKVRKIVIGWSYYLCCPELETSAYLKPFEILYRLLQRILVVGSEFCLHC